MGVKQLPNGREMCCFMALRLAHGFAATLLGAKDKSGGFTPSLGGAVQLCAWL